MSRTPHDQFAKQFLEELLTPLGTVETSREVLGEARLIDLWFQPNPNPQTAAIDLGLLARIAQSPCLIEPFRNAVSAKEIRNCVQKRLTLVMELERKSPKIAESDLPLLCILTPTLSKAILTTYAAQPDSAFPSGVYSLQAPWGTRIIILHQLPSTPETLWLRLLSKGTCQKQAIQEVAALSPSDPRRNLVLKLLVNWRIALETVSPEFQQQEEAIMALSQAYLEWEQKTTQAGVQLGQQQLIQLMLEKSLVNRFGNLDASLNQVIATFTQFSAEEYAETFPLVLTLSYEDLIRRFGQSTSPLTHN